MRIALALAVAVAVTLLAPVAGLAAPPSNDGFDFASAVSLPSTESVDVTEATLESGEQTSWCWPLGGSAWYKLQPSEDTVIRVGTSASPYFDRVVNVYHQTGFGLGGLSFITCGYPWSQITARLTGGETYYVQAGQVSWQPGGLLNLTFEVVPPPANDDFAGALPVGSLPYSDTQSSLAATRETGEPIGSCGQSTANSHWYAFTAPSGGSYTARTSSGTWPVIGLYRGGSVDSLTEVGCRSGNGGALTFHADAGETTYIQISDVNGGNYGEITFNLDVAPAPVAQFWYWPSDPSSLDTISFGGNSYDPGGNPIVEQLFEYGDGASATSCCPQHRYSADGDYTARLTVTTSDGRVGTSEQVIRVRTHDVTITKMQVPQSGNVGQTRQISVGLSNKRYGETVQVQLYKSGPGGFEFVGTLVQSVPVRGGGRTTDFKFSYTFTSADAVLGKVTFKAIAQVVNARDAVPADNEAISLPTKVNG